MAVPAAAVVAPQPSMSRLCPDVDDDAFDALLEADLESLSLAAGGGLASSASEDNSDFLSDPRPPENTLLAHRVKYSYLSKITDCFSHDRFVGKGGFATVYEGITLRSKAKIAVKRLKSSSDRQGG